MRRFLLILFFRCAQCIDVHEVTSDSMMLAEMNNESDAFELHNTRIVFLASDD